MPRHHYATRHAREGRHWSGLEDEPARMLTLRQIEEKRLELIDELAELLIAAAVDLPATT